MNRTFTLD